MKICAVGYRVRSPSRCMPEGRLILLWSFTSVCLPCTWLEHHQRVAKKTVTSMPAWSSSNQSPPALCSSMPYTSPCCVSPLVQLLCRMQDQDLDRHTMVSHLTTLGTTLCSALSTSSRWQLGLTASNDVTDENQKLSLQAVCRKILHLWAYALLSVHVDCCTRNRCIKNRP